MGIFTFFSWGGNIIGGAGAARTLRQSSGLHYMPHKPRRKNKTLHLGDR